MGREENNIKPFTARELEAIKILSSRWVSSEEFTSLVGGVAKRQMTLVKFDRLLLTEETRGKKTFYKILTKEDLERWENEYKKKV